MKTVICMLLALPAAVLSAPVDSTSNPHVAVFDLHTDVNIDNQLGVTNAGRLIANMLANDISVLAPLTAINREAIQRQLDGRRVDLLNPIPPADAKRLGQSLNATTLVTGSIFIAGDGIIIAAKVVSTETGQTFGTMVKSDGTTPIVDLLSKLSMEIGRAALVQQGLEPPHWSPATIVGSCKQGSLISHDEIACVMAVDGRAVPDEVNQWSRKQPVLPGLHEIFVRYYDGTTTAGHNFIFGAKPGTLYEVRYERQPPLNPELWIEDQASHQPVTSKVAVGIDKPRPTLPLIANGPFGHTLRKYNSEYVTPPPTRPK